MKVHLRVRRVAGRTLRVLTLRPGTEVAFSTNRFHQTWHVLSSFAGGRLLAHLLWGLAFQRQPGTLFVIHGPHLRPTPFDADPSSPIVLAPAHLGGLSHGLAKELRRALGALGPPDRSVRWRSHGLREEPLAPTARAGAPRPRDERVQMLGGCLCISAGPETLREIASMIARMRTGFEGRSDYLPFAGHRDTWGCDGEVQLFDEYDRMIAVAREARARVLSRPDDAPPRDDDPSERRRERIWAETESVLARRRWKPLR